MSKPSRFDTGVGIDFETLNTEEAITAKVNDTIIAKKLIVILFNIRHPDRFTLESRMKNWYKTFEKTYDVLFFKCTVTDGKQAVKDKYEIQDPPAVIFFRGGSKIDKIDNFEEADPNIANSAKPNEETNDEKTLKSKIIALQQAK